MSSNITLALKVDVDTERGTRIGVPELAKLFQERHIAATFLFSLGPDNTGRALKRVFRPGFLKKVSRTSVLSTYGLRTLLNGVLWPGPHIANRHARLMKIVEEQGFEVGIHSYDHVDWQDNVGHWTQEKVFNEFTRACQTFMQVFGTRALSAGTAGWQANAKSLQAYDRAYLRYGSDCRGESPFFPNIQGKTFQTLQLPTTLPTLDEIMGRPEFPEEKWNEYLFSLLKPGQLNVFTLHAEIEGMAKTAWFKSFLDYCLQQGVQFKTLLSIADECLQDRSQIPVCAFEQGTIAGRSGHMAVQGKACKTEISVD